MFTPEPDHATAAPPRSWRFWLLLVGVPLLLLGLAAMGWIASVSSGLQRAIAEADAEDPNWRLEELERTRATPPPGQNAAERVVAVSKLLPSGWEMGKSANSPPEINLRQWFDYFAGAVEFLNQQSPPAALDEHQAAVLRGILQTASRATAVVNLLPPNWQAALQPEEGSPPPSPSRAPFELLNNLHPPALLNDAQAAAVRAILQAAGTTALTEARTLIDTPHGRHNIRWDPNFIGTLLPGIQEHRSLASLLRYDALERAQAGDLAGAVAACHAAFHAGCSIGDEPLAISQLVRIACQAVALSMLERTLAQGEPPADRLAALQARLEAEEPAPLLLYSARGERAGGNMLFENLRNGTVPTTGFSGMFSGGTAGGGVDPFALLMRLPGFLTTQHAGHLHYMNELVAVAKRPPEEWEGLFAPMRNQVMQLPILARMLAPAMDKIAQACLRNHAILRTAIVAIAAERFRQQQGRWPESPDELIQAKLLTTVPADPYNGKPIKFVRTPDGLIVYCVGPDGTDDGGKLDRQNPTKAGTDLGFQLWDVPARRGPAPSKVPEPGDGGGPRP